VIFSGTWPISRNFCSSKVRPQLHVGLDHLDEKWPALALIARDVAEQLFVE
jgi:hypothetical protein